MGILDIFGLSGRQPTSGKFTISTSFRPLRLTARSDNSVDLIVELQNNTQEPHLCSLIVQVPKNIGFDGMGISKRKEIRIGQINPMEKKEYTIPLYANNQTTPGTYRLMVSVNTHYRDYSHIINTHSKNVDLRAV